MDFSTFVTRQRWTDVIINIVLIAGPNWFLIGKLPAVPLLRAFGDTAPSLLGTMCATALLLSFLLTFIVFGVTVAQRKHGKVLPALAPETPWLLPALLLALKHVGFVFVPILLLTILLGKAGVTQSFSGPAVVVIATLFGAFLAYVESGWTTRATLKL
jgi:hypothetical protein